MPTISIVYGIYIRMYVRDHPPPHFTAEYQGREAKVGIATGAVIAGRLARVASGIVREWPLKHQAELMAIWGRARTLQPLQKIDAARPRIRTSFGNPEFLMRCQKNG